MIKEVKLPEVSDNVESGDVLKVLVKVGDKIEIDQPLVELETEKATFEVPSTESGVVKEVNVKQGDVINIGDVIVKIETNGEDKKEVKSDNQQSGIITDFSPTNDDAPQPAEEVKSETVVKNKQPVNEPLKKKLTNETGKSSGEDTVFKPETVMAPASPSVRKLARELGVDVTSIKGSGPGERISESDVKTYVKSKMQDGTASVPGQKPLPDFSKWGETDEQPMSKVRALTAESMTYAWTTIPMVTQFDKADITDLEAFRKSYVKKNPESHLTITAILVKVCEAALRNFPQFNSSIDFNERKIVFKKYYNIGVAADTERGLLVPVIKNVERKKISEISKELNELAGKARDKKITPDEMDGGNFTISNLGGIGGTNFTPIVYSPQVAILGVSRGSLEPRFINDNFEPRFLLPLTLTYDHRIIDGADAARFLKYLCDSLEIPMMMFM